MQELAFGLSKYGEFKFISQKYNEFGPPPLNNVFIYESQPFFFGVPKRRNFIEI